MLKMPKAYLGTLIMLSAGCYFGPEPGDTNDGPVADGDPVETTAEGTSEGSGDDDLEPSSEDEEEGEAGEAGTTGAPLDGDCDEEIQWFEGLMQAKCAACHSPVGGMALGDFGNVDDIYALIADEKLINGDAEGSLLYQRFASTDLGFVMPPLTPQPQADIDRLKAFIDGNCMPEYQGDCSDTNVPLDIEAQFQVMRDDISELDDSDQPFTRYLSLAHLHNTGFCTDELAPFRDAMTHAVNAASTEPEIVNPVVVEGSFDTLYRIDIRDYGWDQPVTTTIDADDPFTPLRFAELAFTDKWDMLCNDTPSAVIHDPSLGNDAAGDVQEDAQQGCVMLLADHMAFRAVQPPTYHDLLDLPLLVQDVDQLFLGEPRSVQQLDADVIRAGVLNSGVSQQNRLVERLTQDTNGNYYWVSYDFAQDENDNENLFVNPFGPADPFIAITPNVFAEAGGEALFQLSNGLMGGLLFTSPASAEGGIRLNEGPTFIVTDPKTENGAVLNGMSCFSCHTNGIINVTDELLPNVKENRGLVDAATEDFMDEIYVSPEEFREIAQADSNSFLAAKDKLNLTPNPPKDAVFANYEHYVFIDVPKNLVSAELGVLNQNDLNQCIVDIAAWSPLFAPEGARLARDVFDNRYGDCIEILNLGVSAFNIADVDPAALDADPATLISGL